MGDKACKVLHVLYQSLPDISGSSIRSRDLILAQASIGIEPVAITSPFQRGSKVDAREEDIDGISYYRTWARKPALTPGKKASGLLAKLRKIMTLPQFVLSVTAVAREKQVDIIHAHAMAYCAIAAWLAARLLRKKFVYEIRSAWFLEGRSRHLGWVDRLAMWTEHFVARRADCLVVISQGLRDLYADCDPVVVGNAVGIAVLKRNPTVIPQESSLVKFGYIGSVIPLEGVDLVLEAFQLLRARGVDNSLLIVGGGEHEAACRKRVADAGLTGVQFAGPVSPQRAITLYDCAHVIVNYRRKEPIADLVTPLKPLEAMASGCIVVVSDVRGMTELVKHHDTGFVVEAERPSQLADTLVFILDHIDELRAIGGRAREFVRNERCWEAMALRYRKLYEAL